MISELVKVFRGILILELSEADFIDTELSHFPYGACEATSQMLAVCLDLTAHPFSKVDEDFYVISEYSFHSRKDTQHKEKIASWFEGCQLI